MNHRGLMGSSGLDRPQVQFKSIDAALDQAVRSDRIDEPFNMNTRQRKLIMSGRAEWSGGDAAELLDRCAVSIPRECWPVTVLHVAEMATAVLSVTGEIAHRCPRALTAMRTLNGRGWTIAPDIVNAVRAVLSGPTSNPRKGTTA